MLIRLLYTSTTRDRMELDQFRELLKQAQTNNTQRDLTGMLAFNNSIFLQALEGDREVINTLYGKLLRDPRHHKVVLMSCHEISERHWGQWSMGFAAPKAENRALFLKYSQQSIFNPYAMTADGAEKMLKELSHTATALHTEAAKQAPVAEAETAENQLGSIFSRMMKR